MMTMKERFFYKHLVPAGQMLEVLHGLQYSGMERHPLWAGFDTLGLVSCYVIHPHTTVLDEVQAAVENLTREMLAVIDTLGSARGNHICEVLMRKYSGVMRTRYGAQLHTFLQKLPDLYKSIHTAIQYDPAKRQAWLNAYTSSTSSLTTGGRTNRWRTFVRNLSWDVAAERMGVTERVGNLRKTAYRCDAGVKSATSLWGQVFAETVVVPAPATGGDPARAMVPVPNGVQIAVTPDKLLGVSVAFDPVTLLGAERAKEMAARQKQGQAISTELAKALTPCYFQEKTDIVGLAEVVARAEGWIAEQRTGETLLCELYGQWLIAMRLADVRKKLGKHFSADEHALLLQALAETSGTPA